MHTQQRVVDWHAGRVPRVIPHSFLIGGGAPGGLTHSPFSPSISPARRTLQFGKGGGVGRQALRLLGFYFLLAAHCRCRLGSTEVCVHIVRAGEIKAPPVQVKGNTRGNVRKCTAQNTLSTARSPWLSHATPFSLPRSLLAPSASIPIALAGEGLGKKRTFCCSTGGPDMGGVGSMLAPPPALLGHANANALGGRSPLASPPSSRRYLALGPSSPALDNWRDTKCKLNCRHGLLASALSWAAED